MKAEINKFARYAKKTLKKDQRVSIRISKQDLIDIQTKAIDEGIPYQTLITSIVHKYKGFRGKFAQEYEKLEALAVKEKGKEKHLTKKFIDALKNSLKTHDST